MNMFRQLKADEIECRVAQISDKGLFLLLYKDARCDMNILDETVGALNWKREHTRDNKNCIVSIWDKEKSQWISKEDTGTESNTEAEKGLASDSFKRACFNWGIGRELYTAPSIFIYPNKEIKYKNGGKEVEEFYEYKEGKYTTKTQFKVDYIDYKEKVITDLVIRDQKGNIRFEQLTVETQKKINEQFTKLRDLIQKNEDKDDNFDRENFYKYFKVSNDNQLTFSQRNDAITLLESRLNK